MAKRYTLLHKKLRELKSELNEMMTLPAESPYYQLFSEDIDGKVMFLKRLISAETQSHPQQKPHHLHHITQRLEELESDFNDRHSLGTSPVNDDHHTDSASSTCSCTESCFNDDEDGGDGSLDLDDVHHHQDPEIGSEGLIQEQQPVVINKDDDDVEEGEEERKLGCGNKVSAVMSGGVMLTVAVMGVVMASFCGSFCYSTGLEGFLPPT